MAPQPTSPHDPETIAAIATPPGRGGIGIVRLSGPQATRIAARLVRLRRPLQPGRAVLAGVLDPALGPEDPEAVPIDEAVVTAFLAPHSYTAEDVVEIAAHGSPVVLDQLLHAALRAGARLARPGEFTERAFLNGRLDLTQAEAVHDLIAARTLEQARMAAQQLGGALSRRVAPVKEELLTLIALLEAGMDFAAGELDDVDVLPPARIGATLAHLRAPLERLAQSYAHGHRLREGVSLALVGRPNVGKSSLFNRLLQRDRAIVTPLPGTTRDTVEEGLALGGIPLRLIDTAGLRRSGEAPADEAEALGIARSREALADADLVLLVLDATAPTSTEETDLLRSLDGRPHLVVRNKSDLLKSSTSDQAMNNTLDQTTNNPSAQPESAQREDGNTSAGQPDSIYTSALTGEGLDELRAAILRLLGAAGEIAAGGALNSLRQHQAVHDALDALSAAGTANASGIPHEFLLTDLHAALRALDTLTGATTTSDILDRIFSTFCIGK